MPIYNPRLCWSQSQDGQKSKSPWKQIRGKIADELATGLASEA